jgi:dephospho-CoA kinase
VLHVGLTGGLASGKSVVGRELERLGCRVIRLDDIGHQVLARDGEAYALVVAAFGPDILAPDGSINRQILGRRVFADPEQLIRLNALVHPLIRERAHALRDAFAIEHPGGILVTEAAIMIETGSYKEYDRVIVAVSRPEQQLERALQRGLGRSDALARIGRQMPIGDKLKYADFVVDTSDTEESTLEQTRRLYLELRSLVK